MKLTPEELEDNGYQLIEKLDHKELIPFVKKYLYRFSFWPVLYFSFNFALLAIIGGMIVKAIAIEEILVSKALGSTALGFAFAFLLIPLHEYIHAIAYRICGAKEVSYDADLKKMIFMAIAHRFVAGKKDLQLVAIAPFALISLLALAAIPFSSGYQIYTIVGLIFTHAAFCGGDFAMLSYYSYHKNIEVVTWDDKENKVSYFLGKPTP
ncbi:MAG: DUF3267 domain-containing protein [Lentimicrobium sp.]|nr:DUF3267 domain-containing protein [Lentimicrobium sp.]